MLFVKAGPWFINCLIKTNQLNTDLITDKKKFEIMFNILDIEKDI